MSERRGKKKSQSQGMSLFQKAQMFADIIDGKSTLTITRVNKEGDPEICRVRLPDKYHAIEMEPGAYLVMRETSGRRLEIVREKALKNALMECMKEYLGGVDELNMLGNSLDSIIEYWIATTKHVGFPRLVGFASDPEMVVGRVPFDPQPSGDCPTWDEVCSRMSDPEAFRAWIGSVFDLNSQNQQYLWIHGAGNDGKGSITRFLARALGKAFVVVNSLPSKNNMSSFFTSRFLNKRLCVFPDMNEPRFAQNDLFKSLTGGDPVWIEFKGKDGFTTDLNCKYLITSNVMPDVGGGEADMRRAICITMSPGVSSKGFEARLWDEGAVFLSKCLVDYQSKRCDDGRIVAENLALRSWVEELDSEFEHYFEQWFEECPEEQSSLCSKLTEAMVLRNWPRRRQSEFRAWLKQSKKIQPVLSRSSDKVARIYRCWKVRAASSLT